MLIFQPKKEGRKQVWRGRDYSMAWTVGLVDADFPHERT
jgi:hypothetical protein